MEELLVPNLINVLKSEIMCIDSGRSLEDERKLIHVTKTNILKILRY